jgi:hypothetical protein
MYAGNVGYLIQRFLYVIAVKIEIVVLENGIQVGRIGDFLAQLVNVS